MTHHLQLSDIWYAGLALIIFACGVAGLGEMRHWLGESRQLDRVQRLADIDNARGTPVRREPTLADLVVNPEVERYAEVRARATGNPGRTADCLFCAPFWDASQPCQCGAVPCRDPGCGALVWQAVSNAEELER